MRLLGGAVRILMVSTEFWPMAKVGGLADAVSSLSRSLKGLGHDVRCALPGYRGVEDRIPPGSWKRDQRVVPLSLRGGWTDVTVSRLEGEGLPVPVTLVVHDLFNRSGIYGDPMTREGYLDNGLRWAVFCRGVHAALGRDGWTPDVVHAHDHQAALVPALLRWGNRPGALPGRPATVFTIHNMGYQGIEDRSWIADSGLPQGLDYPGGPLEFHGRVNLMKLGIEAADFITTVSPRYAQEIRSSAEFGAGLEGVVARRAARLTGILNGIDTEIWDPAVDSSLPFRYTRSRLGGKSKNQAALREELGLPVSEPPAPLVGMVGRLAAQKGFDLLLSVLHTILEDGIQMAILGSGEERYEAELRRVAMLHEGQLALRLAFDEGLAHRIEAGADIFLMPSRYEPCGLNQMYSLRYGTVPVVRAVGGLADTVLDIDEDPRHGNGFVFNEYEPAALLDALHRAVRVWRDRKRWRQIVLRGMKVDSSWDVSAGRYEVVYRDALASVSHG